MKGGVNDERVGRWGTFVMGWGRSVHCDHQSLTLQFY